MTGAAGVFYGAQTLPRPDFEGEVLGHVAASPDELLSPALILLIAGTAMIFGLPSVFTLFGPRARVGVFGLALVACGAVALTGVAQQLMLVRTLVADQVVTPAEVEQVMANGMHSGLLVAAYLCFNVGELCVAWALMRACGVPRWIPGLLVAHVLVAVGSRALELGPFETLPVVLLSAALAAIGITANVKAQPTGVSSRDIAERHRLEQAAR